MYDYVSGVVGAPVGADSSLVWVSGLILLVLIIGLVYCFSRLFR